MGLLNSQSPYCVPLVYGHSHLILRYLSWVEELVTGIPVNLENGGAAFADSIWASKQ